jgi:hypothetical protein
LHPEDGGGAGTTEAPYRGQAAGIIRKGSYESIAAVAPPEAAGPPVTGAALEQYYDDRSPAFFVAGYGATRRVEHLENLDVQAAKRRGLRYQRVAGLFEDYIALTPLGGWLPTVQTRQPRRFREVASLLNELLPEGTTFTGDFAEGEALFTHRTVRVPFGALSDGYRGYVGLLGDLLYHLHLCCPPRKKLTNLPGLVLIDDVELQLHPSWQRVVVPTLARSFPHLQFVLTTHSPIVAGSLHSTNVFLTEPGDAGASQVTRVGDRLHGLNADQVLLSPYFGLPSSRAEDAVRHLRDLSDDVTERGDPDSAIAFLHELAGKTDEVK